MKRECTVINNKRIIIVGATGRVGREMLSILAEYKVPSENIDCAASERSAGQSLAYRNTNISVKNIHNVDFSQYDIGLFSAGAQVSAEYAPKAAEKGCIVIDNTSFFRMHDDIALIVPEINFNSYYKCSNKHIIANPNCSTIQTVMALKPLHDAFGLEEVVVSTYQSVSGAGQKGINELLAQTTNPSQNPPTHFKKPIAFNIIPQIDVFMDSLYTKEEEKMRNEIRKILGLPNLKVAATCVRVPVLVGHAVSVWGKFSNHVDIQKSVEILHNFPGISVVDNPKNYQYITPIDCAGKNDVFISRIRKHPDSNNVLLFWCVADNLRKGAALNSLQILQNLCAKPQ